MKSIPEYMLACCAAALLSPTVALAQQVGASLGTAIPINALADSRDVGFRGSAFVSTNSGALRLELAIAAMSGGENDTASAWRRGEWRTISLGVAFRPAILHTNRSRARLVLGAAAHQTSIPGVSNPHGIVPGVIVGVGVETERGRFLYSLDAGWHIVLSDFGVPEYNAAAFVPIAVGIAWKL